MRIAHLLRKYDPAEWGGTETAIRDLVKGLGAVDVESVVYCPSFAPGKIADCQASRSARNGLRIADSETARAAGSATNPQSEIRNPKSRDPLAEAGCAVQRFRACVPVWGLSAEQRRQMIAVGGNLMSFDLLRALWRAPRFSVIHSHALGRIGGIGLTIARRKRIPFVVTVHGGVYDLPEAVRSGMAAQQRGVEWGKPFGYFLRARRVLEDADAILTCNRREAALIQQRHPDRRVVMQPHGVPAAVYEPDHRAAARAAFPAVVDRDVLLSIGRIDSVKNQGWLVEQVPELVRRHPRLLLVLAGACTDEAYGAALERRIGELGLGSHVLLTGKLPPADPRLIGLLQEARAAVLPSISETFGLVILEAWAAGTPAISSRTSGASALLEDGKSGWLFDLDRPELFHAAVDTVWNDPDARRRVVAAGRERVVADFDTRVLAARLQRLYEELREEHHAHDHPA